MTAHFAQADTIIPEPTKPIAWDRYSYTHNNPVNFSDPSGHMRLVAEGEDGYGNYSIPTNPWSYSWDNNNDGEANSNSEIKKLARLQKFAEKAFVEYLNNPVKDPNIVTTKFGYVNTLGGAGYHPGVDIASIIRNKKVAIYATAYGKIVQVDKNPNGDFGAKVVIEHDIYGVKFYSVYAHLSKVSNVKEGDVVGPDTNIGKMGNTPFSDNESIHLHFEVRKVTDVILSPSGNFVGLPGYPNTFWATRDTMHLQWVDISPKFGGVSQNWLDYLNSSQ